MEPNQAELDDLKANLETWASQLDLTDPADSIRVIESSNPMAALAARFSLLAAGMMSGCSLVTRATRLRS